MPPTLTGAAAGSGPEAMARFFTGATGCVGRHLSERARKSGHVTLTEKVALALLAPEVHG